MIRKRPRLKTFDYCGRHHYFLTFCTHQRAPVFTRAEPVDLVLDQIVRSATQLEFAITAYVFMPDHLHLVLHGLSQNADLKACAVLAKQRSAYEYSRIYGRRLWQPSYYDHVIRDEEGILGFLAYLVMNPVEAGLVERPEDYPFTGSLTMTREEMIAIIRNVAPLLLVR
ncbi:MAG: hypothetical protein A3H96_16825 [Acidobacteria bacterium RIFCSPLOWO2_02_FULL_67_36]|nr:MAG: hypothetical protein A3H96_16825 [Acidobacteria bacterium RIFCSPLOWO2_02_FULL_67_36]OFW21511.1 MAG: hypothetical protein A3G21_00140 [Acidobacteria bacterium RIFCSPLOWO2_12_FULL_66_21]